MAQLDPDLVNPHDIKRTKRRGIVVRHCAEPRCPMKHNVHYQTLAARRLRPRPDRKGNLLQIRNGSILGALSDRHGEAKRAERMHANAACRGGVSGRHIRKPARSTGDSPELFSRSPIFGNFGQALSAYSACNLPDESTTRQSGPWLTKQKKTAITIVAIET